MAEGLFGGRIALGDEIGRGAMGVVFQAELEDEPVAVKVLHPHLTSDLSVVGRFVREHQALSRIDHPNVVRVVELIIDDPRLGIVMEHLDYPDLGKVIGGENIDPVRAVSLGAGIASGVAAIHEARVVHRDLKPANVIVAHDGRSDVPKIADFGVSRLVGQSIVSSTTTLGTPLYMSPEAAGGTTPIGRPADVYSLGVILFEMLTGRPPYTAEEPIAIAVAHVNNPIPILGGIPDSLSELLQAMLAKDPGRRPDAADVEGSLASLAGEMSPTLTPVILNEDVLDLDAIEAMRVSSTMDHLSMATMPFSQVANQFVDQTVAGARPAPPGDTRRGLLADNPGPVGPSAPSLKWAPVREVGPPTAGDDHTTVYRGPATNRSGAILESPDDQGAGYGDGASTGLHYPPPSPAGRRADSSPPYSPAGQPRPPSGVPSANGYHRPMSTTTSSSVERRRTPWIVFGLLVLLIPLVWFILTRLDSSGDSPELPAANAAYSFVPRVGTNGLITTRRWELTTNNQRQAIIEAEVIVTNTSDDPVTANHYEAFPEVVDVDYLINTFNPEPDAVILDPGVAIFELGQLAPKGRFLLTYRMLAPEGVLTTDELQALAESQADVEMAFLESLPDEEALSTEGELTELRLSPASIELAVGETARAELLGTLSDGSAVDPAALAAAVWVIEDPDIAEVTSTNAIRGLKTGSTTLTIAVGEIEVVVDVDVTVPDGDEVAGPSTTDGDNSTTSSSASTTTSASSSTSQDSTTSSSASSSSTSTNTTTDTSTTNTTVEPTLTMTPLIVEKRANGGFTISFSTNLCTIANFSSDAGHSYVTPGWPDVGETCWLKYGQNFAPMGPGTYNVVVKTRSRGGQQAQRTTTVIIDQQTTTTTATSVTTASTEP